ncbi:MAG: glutamate ABC transporter substrate-binding protein [Coriobacteriales bacterium]
MKFLSAKGRQVLAISIVALMFVAMLGLVGCGGGGDEAAPADDAAAAAEEAAEAEPVAIDTEAYDALIASGPVASDEAIASSEWATAIKEAGTMRVGGVQTSALFSLLNEVDGVDRGMDAGLFQLLTRYILGDETAYQLTQVTSDTRESVLQNNQVDAVFATYSITPERQELISFAGPYFIARQAILVKADNTDINGVDDLAGKNVAVQSGSTGPGIVEEYAPEAIQQEFSTDEEARTALEQGRVDAYVIDETMQAGSIIKAPGKYKIVGEPFGPEDPYGIGLPLDSDGVEFVNGFLKQIEEDGTWADLWKITIGDRTGQETAPEPPAIG